MTTADRRFLTTQGLTLVDQGFSLTHPSVLAERIDPRTGEKLTCSQATSAGEVTTPSGRRAKVTWASEIEPEPVIWAWEDGDAGRIPAGALVSAAGREGTGKSSFGKWLTAQVTRGTLTGNLFGTPRTVLYVAIEDSWAHTIVPRLLAAGADLSKVGRFDVVSDEDMEVTLSLPVDNRLLETQILEHQVALVVVDPLMSVVSEKIDTHRERDVRTALDPLAKIAARTGAVILGIAHFSKGGGTDAASLITGSGAFKNVPRAIFGFAVDPDTGERVMTQVKNSLGRCDLPSLSYEIEEVKLDTKKGISTTSRFVFTGESERSVRDMLGSQDVGQSGARQDTKTWLADLLNDGPMKAADVQDCGKANGYAWRTIQDARDAAGIITKRKGFGKGSVVWWAHTRDQDSIDAIHAASAKQENDRAYRAYGEGGAYGRDSPSADVLPFPEHRKDPS